MTDKLITRTTGIALCSFDSLIVRRATLRTKNYLLLTGGGGGGKNKKKNGFFFFSKNFFKKFFLYL